MDKETTEYESNWISFHCKKRWDLIICKRLLKLEVILLSERSHKKDKYHMSLICVVYKRVVSWWYFPDAGQEEAETEGEGMLDVVKFQLDKSEMYWGSTTLWLAVYNGNALHIPQIKKLNST